MIRTDNSKVIELLQSQLEEKEKEFQEKLKEIRDEIEGGMYKYPDDDYNTGFNDASKEILGIISKHIKENTKQE